MKTWRERIAEARERGEFSDEDASLSANWSTCAVGEQHALYPEIITYRMGVEQKIPIHSELIRLGGCRDGGFNQCVTENSIDIAERRLDEIEDFV